MKQICIILFLVIGINQIAISQNDTARIKTTAYCDMCKTTLENELSFEKGVKKSVLDLDTKIITVIYNPAKTDLEKIRKAITRVGYDADTLTADPKAYNRLPDCCKKPMIE